MLGIHLNLFAKLNLALRALKDGPAAALRPAPTGPKGAAAEIADAYSGVQQKQPISLGLANRIIQNASPQERESVQQLADAARLGADNLSDKRPLGLLDSWLRAHGDY